MIGVGFNLPKIGAASGSLTGAIRGLRCLPSLLKNLTNSSGFAQAILDVSYTLLYSIIQGILINVVARILNIYTSVIDANIRLLQTLNRNISIVRATIDNLNAAAADLMDAINGQQNCDAVAGYMTQCITNYVRSQITPKIAASIYRNSDNMVGAITNNIIADDGVLRSYADRQINAVNKLNAQLSL